MGRTFAIKQLTHIVTLFAALKVLYITIDGRALGPRGADLLISATAEHHDYYMEDGRQMYLEWLSSIIKEIRACSYDLKILEVHLTLAVNEELLTGLERRWGYWFATCHFCAPDFTGHRFVSRSATPESLTSSSDGGGSDVETGRAHIRLGENSQ